MSKSLKICLTDVPTQAAGPVSKFLYCKLIKSYPSPTTHPVKDVLLSLMNTLVSHRIGSLLLIVIAGCYAEPTVFREETVFGYRPIYGEKIASEIKFLDPAPIENPGKIYIYGDYLLVNEIKKGIHVFDNTDPEAPRNMGFIQMLGNTDMAIKDGVLYADHIGQLVALSIDDFSTLQERGRLTLQNWERGVPPPASSYFECVDPEKGIVVAWKPDQLKNPDCYANW